MKTYRASLNEASKSSELIATAEESKSSHGYDDDHSGVWEKVCDSGG